MNKLTKLSLAVVIGSLMMPAFASKTEPYTQSGTNAREMLVEQPIHWISVDQIKKELEGKAPINVSFDMTTPCYLVALASTTVSKNTHQANKIT